MSVKRSKVKAAIVVPPNELWLHQEPLKSRLDAALEWAATHEPQITDLDELEARLMANLEARERSVAP